MTFTGHFKPSSSLEECISPIAFIRESASSAVASFIDQFPTAMPQILTKIQEIYEELSEIRGAVFDDVGRMQKDAIDEWERRSGVGLALGKLAELVEADDAIQLIKIVSFFLLFVYLQYPNSGSTQGIE